MIVQQQCKIMVGYSSYTNTGYVDGNEEDERERGKVEIVKDRPPSR
jgi:hypothetical protein